MTPKEKAIDLKNRYYYALPNNGSLNQGINSCESRHAEAIKCALIAVDEILPIVQGYEDALSASQTSDEYEWWQEVKQELEQL